MLAVGQSTSYINNTQMLASSAGGLNEGLLSSDLAVSSDRNDAESTETIARKLTPMETGEPDASKMPEAYGPQGEFHGGDE
ncbi:hypothetical protein TUM12370_20970 [Salmonella enterica subsp. enterica serovar Choleraesuis]|nr:hypothetical protein TUM12370_20970 [Salmonella enterica subsp. enterica serovar Choleraesuis]